MSSGSENLLGDEVATLRLPLSGEFSLGADLSCECSVFIPDGKADALLICFPGGGYSRRYYDFSADYSMARFLAAAGFLVVTVDQLGVGGSSHPDPSSITAELMAEANSQATRTIFELFTQDSNQFAECLTTNFRRIGIGHSAGGGLLIMQQAGFRDFEGLITMGWSAVRMPTSVEMCDFEGKCPLPKARITPPKSAEHEGYQVNIRGAIQHHWYHWDDVPAKVIEADDAAAVEFPPCMGLMNKPGYVSGTYAPLVDVPIRLLFGQRDLRLESSNELAAYPNSPDIKSFILPRSGHCHCFASTRKDGWQKIADWCEEFI